MKTANGTEYKYTREELETIHRYDAVDKAWYTWSNIPKHIDEMRGKGWEVVFEDQYGVKFKAPPFALKVGKAYKVQLSEEEKARRAARLKSLRIQGENEA